MGAARRLGGSAWRGPLRKVAPFAIAGAVAIAILRRYSASAIASSFAEGDALHAAPFAILLALSFLSWGALADTVVLRRFGSLRFVDVARGKAAAAVLTALGYFFSNGGYAVWIARRTHVGGARSASLVLYLMMGDLGAVGVVASLVMPFVPVPSALRLVAGLLAALPLAAIVFGPWIPADRARWLDPLREIPRSVGLAQLALRCVNVGFAALFMALAARSFGLTVPMGVLLACAPILVLVGSLPVNVAGIGAAQGAWLLFLLPFETGPKILAFQLAWTAMLGTAFVLRGLPFLRRTLAEVAGPPDR
jgi:hypothetical protein